MGALNPEMGMQLVREAMEAFVEPRTAATIVFEALTPRSSGLPSTPGELSRFVRGALRKVAEDKLGERRSREMVDHIDSTLTRLTTAAPEEIRADRTLEMDVAAGPVFVMVFSGSSSLAIALRAAIGGERLGVRAVASSVELKKVSGMFPAHLVVVDAVSPPELEPAEVRDFIATLPPNSTRLVWGCDLPYGISTTTVLTKAGVQFTPVSERDGVEPLLDMLRSRLAQ